MVGQDGRLCRAVSRKAKYKKLKIKIKNTQTHRTEDRGNQVYAVFDPRDVAVSAYTV